MTISEADFDILSSIEVRHRATGATFATYRYESPTDAGTTLTENHGRAGDGNHPTVAELRPVAVALLRRLALQAAKKVEPKPAGGWT